MKYKKFNGTQLPDSAVKIAMKQKVFQYTDTYVAAYYKGDPETSTDWVFVTDDGGFYKVGAYLMIWFECNHEFPIGGGIHYGKTVAIWSEKFYKKALKRILNGEKPGRDPYYQT